MAAEVSTPAVVAGHRLHAPDRTWSETNCYLDLWIELLHARGHDPVPACAAVLSSGWEVDQWTFVKPLPEDLALLYGLHVAELNPWDRLAGHVAGHLAAGHLVTVEVDAWWLPDTAGTSYRTAHEKTSIAPLALDVQQRWLRYAHGAGVFEAVGEDVDQLLTPGLLAPYTELVRVGTEPTGPLAERALARARAHLVARPAGDQVAPMGEHLRSVLPRLSEEAFFHAYAFATWRQLGSAAGVAGDLARWLDPVAPGAAAAGSAFDAVATGAKSLQFSLARASRGRQVDLDAPVAALGAGWAEGTGLLAAACGV